jgi:hypothetical protein
MQILGKSKYGTMEVQCENSMVCWLSAPRWIDGRQYFFLTGQFQCICGGKWPVVAISAEHGIEILECLIDDAISKIQTLAEKSTLCGEGHAGN